MCNVFKKLGQSTFYSIDEFSTFRAAISLISRDSSAIEFRIMKNFQRLLFISMHSPPRENIINEEVVGEGEKRENFVKF